MLYFTEISKTMNVGTIIITIIISGVD